MTVTIEAGVELALITEYVRVGGSGGSVFRPTVGSDEMLERGGGGSLVWVAFQPEVTQGPDV